MTICASRSPWRGSVVASNQEPTVAEVTFSPFRLIWRSALSLGLIWFLACAIQTAYIRYNSLQPREHFNTLLDYYGSEIENSTIPAKLAEHGYWMLFKATPSQREFFKESADQGDRKPFSNQLKRGINAVFKIDIETITYTTLLVAIKLGLLASAAVSWVLVLGVAVIDGWCQRYIRTACGGNESATIYHTAKLWSSRLVPLFAVVVFLCLPAPLSIAWVFVPAVSLMAVLLRIRATYYKKYL
jgi:integrating conjugative element membrane protein (TIGR03747 family)